MEAIELINIGVETLNDRAKEYDPKAKAERSMDQIVKVFNAFHNTELTTSQGWHFMQILKDVRLFSSPKFHQDSAVDGTMYSALKGEAMSIQKGDKQHDLHEPKHEVS